MGNQGLVCCASGDGTVPANFDMHNPTQAPSIFLPHGPCSTVENESDSQEDVALRMIGKLANPSIDNSLRGQLLKATRQDDAAAVLQFVADGAEIADMSESLRLASQRGSASVVRELIAVGLTVNESCPHSGFSPLHLASASGHLTVCELLLDALADVQKVVDGTTALALAHKMGNTEVEEILERHVASLLREGEAGEDPVSRRAHVLPRVSPVLSEAILQALPTHSVLSPSPQSQPQSPSVQNPAQMQSQLQSPVDSPSKDTGLAPTSGQQPTPPEVPQ